MSDRAPATDKEKRAQQQAENATAAGEPAETASTRYSSRGPLPGVAQGQGQGQGQGQQTPTASEQAYDREEEKRSID